MRTIVTWSANPTFAAAMDADEALDNVQSLCDLVKRNTSIMMLPRELGAIPPVIRAKILFKIRTARTYPEKDRNIIKMSVYGGGQLIERTSVELNDVKLFLKDVINLPFGIIMITKFNYFQNSPMMEVNRLLTIVRDIKLST